MENTKVPPYHNMGVQDTSECALIPCMDWVQVTFKNVSVVQLIEDVLQLNVLDFVSLNHGRWGYASSLQCGHITIYSEGYRPEEMGIHLLMTGQGCREYENFGKIPWDILLQVMLTLEGNFTRLDVAIDDFKGYWKIKQAIRKVKAGEVVSKFKHARRVEKILISDGSTQGETLYFGSDTSAIKIRMYDKLLEQKSKGNPLPDGVKDIWNRTEVEIRDDRAQSVALLIADGKDIGMIVSGILKHYVRFCIKSNDTNRSRWKTAPFWEKFLEGIEPLRLATALPEASIETKVKWMKRSVSKSFAMVIEAMEGDTEIFHDMLREGKRKMKPKDDVNVQDFIRKRDMRDMVDSKQNAQWCRQTLIGNHVFVTSQLVYHKQYTIRHDKFCRMVPLPYWLAYI